MSRQVGTVLGVSVLVAVLGSHASYGDTHEAFQVAWVIIACAALIAAACSFGMTPGRDAPGAARKPRRTLLAFADRR